MRTLFMRCADGVDLVELGRAFAGRPLEELDLESAKIARVGDLSKLAALRDVVVPNEHADAIAKTLIGGKWSRTKERIRSTRFHRRVSART
ncbi:MAG: hypothetical protein KIT31_18650 [Deltaproteobacteria bacterium]|nr:hypothetical protein [Deltaproteobacteria bacterium]